MVMSQSTQNLYTLTVINAARIPFTRGASSFQNSVSYETYRRLVQMSHLQYTAKSHHLQWNVHQLSQICHRFYQNYCPDSFKHRHNVSLAKVSDESILILLLLQAELGITSQRHFYSICHLFPGGQLVERSHFNRRSK